MLELNSVPYAFLLTTLAGLGTGVGATFAFFLRKTNTKFLAFILGFSAGVMIYVSFVEIFPQAQTVLVLALGKTKGEAFTLIAFFAGIFVIALIDKCVPDYQNPHQMHTIEEMDAGLNNLPKTDGHDFAKLNRVGIMTAITIAIHNFPEGIATFASALNDPTTGLVIAVAIAIHNIPEGIAISVPLFYATGDRKKSFFYSFLSGLAEPLGAVVTYLILMPFLSPVVFGCLFASVAGIMVFISLDELLPAAEEYGEQHMCTYGTIAGMAVMGVSLLLL